MIIRTSPEGVVMTFTYCNNKKHNKVTGQKYVNMLVYLELLNIQT